VTKSAHATTRDLTAALKRHMQRTGSSTPSVRGAELMLAVVTDVLTGGLVEVDGDMTVRRLASYTTPADGDLILIGRFGNGNWVAIGRLAT
jgi:predicted ribosome-associated RNA-binding protein Tma20